MLARPRRDRRCRSSKGRLVAAASGYPQGCVGSEGFPRVRARRWPPPTHAAAGPGEMPALRETPPQTPRARPTSPVCLGSPVCDRAGDAHRLELWLTASLIVLATLLTVGAAVVLCRR